LEKFDQNKKRNRGRGNGRLCINGRGEIPTTPRERRGKIVPERENGGPRTGTAFLVAQKVRGVKLAKKPTQGGRSERG